MAKSKLELIRERKLKVIKPKTVTKKWLYPNGIEREYHRDLNRLVAILTDRIKTYLLPEVPSMIDEVDAVIPNDRADDFLDRLHAIILFISRSMQDDIDRTIALADSTALQINAFNKNQFQKLTEQAFQVNPFIQEPWLLDQLKLFGSQNAQLIKSLPDQELERVSGIVERGLQEGKTYSDIAKEMQKSFGITRRRATLIARDQTKKLNSSLTKLRQQEIGVTEYIWQTSGDERVRPTHAANDGKKFRWDKPPKTGHPGDEVNCRCVAIAVLDNILDLG